MSRRTETVAGYIVDMTSLRKWPYEEFYERARYHSRDHVIKGSSLESGYAIVDEEGFVILLDSDATPLIYDLLQASSVETGIRIRVEREMEENNMRTVLATYASF